jgi:hypothetical protein
VKDAATDAEFDQEDGGFDRKRYLFLRRGGWKETEEVVVVTSYVGYDTIRGLHYTLTLIQ